MTIVKSEHKEAEVLWVAIIFENNKFFNQMHSFRH